MVNLSECSGKSLNSSSRKLCLFIGFAVSQIQILSQSSLLPEFEYNRHQVPDKEARHYSSGRGGVTYITLWRLHTSYIIHYTMEVTHRERNLTCNLFSTQTWYKLNKREEADICDQYVQSYNPLPTKYGICHLQLRAFKEWGSKPKC